jgi:hypothetical protein
MKYRQSELYVEILDSIDSQEVWQVRYSKTRTESAKLITNQYYAKVQALCFIYRLNRSKAMELAR